MRLEAGPNEVARGRIADRPLDGTLVALISEHDTPESSRTASNIGHSFKKAENIRDRLLEAMLQESQERWPWKRGTF